MNEELKFVCVLFLVVVLLFASLFFIGAGWEYNICKTRISLSPDYNYKWVLFGGCLVETPSGYWVHYDDNVKVIDGQLLFDNE